MTPGDRMRLELQRYLDATQPRPLWGVGEQPVPAHQRQARDLAAAAIEAGEACPRCGQPGDCPCPAPRAGVKLGSAALQTLQPTPRHRRKGA